MRDVVHGYVIAGSRGAIAAVATTPTAAAPPSNDHSDKQTNGGSMSPRSLKRVNVEIQIFGRLCLGKLCEYSGIKLESKPLINITWQFGDLLKSEEGKKEAANRMLQWQPIVKLWPWPR